MVPPIQNDESFLKELATDKSGKVMVAKVNVDENPHTPRKYNVMGVPHVMLFKSGQVMPSKPGYMPKSKLDEWVESVL